MTGNQRPRAGVLLLHAYSSKNAGDGLLVAEAIRLVRDARGADVPITLAASDPESFRGWGVRVVDSRPGLRGWDREYRRTLAGIDDFESVVGVGGGYLRFGRPLEAAKALLVHGPQLRAAARRGRGAVYLPMSVGPLRLGTRASVVDRLDRMDAVFVRDDRSLAEAGRAATRSTDMGTMVEDWQPSRQAVDPVPVLSARAVRGRVPSGMWEVANRLAVFDGLVQSAVRANDDRAAVASLHPRRLVPGAELTGPGPGRVLVAIRLHAAVMALAAGHYAIHLAYERKGFGVFADLDLGDWVHPVGSFDPGKVCAQVAALAGGQSRDGYAERLAAGRSRAVELREALVTAVRR